MRAVGKIASMTKMGRLDMKHIFLQYEGTSEMDHLIKVSAAKSDDLSSILVTHTVRKRTDFPKLSLLSHTQ